MLKKFLLISLFVMTTGSHASRLDDIADRLDEIEDQMLFNQALKNLEWAKSNNVKNSMVTSDDLFMEAINGDRYYLKANGTKTIKPGIQFITVLVEANGTKIDPKSQKEFLGSALFFLINCSANSFSLNGVYMYDKNLKKVRQVDLNLPFAPIKQSSYVNMAKHMVCP
ncbi:hypothetical protein G6680_08325 [Polynucleobacter paneuropaeus]|nr:hypothetical protein [Polynucleobacter paneuropaeus]